MKPKSVPLVTFPNEHKSVPLSCRNISFRDLSEISRGSGGGGGGTEGGSQLFETGRDHEKWAVKRGRVMQIYVRVHEEVHPQKKKKFFIL